MKLKPYLGAFYSVWTVNRTSLFYSSWNPHQSYCRTSNKCPPALLEHRHQNTPGVY